MPARTAAASVRSLHSARARACAVLAAALVGVALHGRQPMAQQPTAQMSAAQQQPTPPPPPPGPPGIDDGAPHGTVTKHTWTTSKIFPGTQRDYWVYVPAQYDGKTPACVMVFQDGAGYVDPKGWWRVPLVFDTLINRKEMPVTIGIFISPGIVPAASPDALPRYNRSFEYDAVGDRYARFLLNEILPEVGKQYRLAPDGNSRAIAGASSGAIAAFTVAWEHPEAFSRVLSTIGTYVGFRGGHEYPFLIRKTEPKPLRIFLEDGTADNNNYGGDWYLANQTMLSALTFSGYEVNHFWAEGGGHESRHGAPILLDMLRWLWKDYPTPIAAGVGSKQPIMDVLEPNEAWQPMATSASSATPVQGDAALAGPVANADGDLFFVDPQRHRIYKAHGDAAPQVFANDISATSLAVGPDGRLYAGLTGRRGIVAFDANGHQTTIAGGIDVRYLTISATGRIYATETNGRNVWLIDAAASNATNGSGKASIAKPRAIADLAAPLGVQLTPDQTLLYVTSAHERMVQSFQIQPDGTLAHGQPYCHLQAPPDETSSGVGGMTVDSLGRVYVTTTLGVQICDQIGRVNGIIVAPQRGVTRVAFGGPKLDTLYVTASSHVYRRKTKATGVLSFQKPIKPPVPRL